MKKAVAVMIDGAVNIHLPSDNGVWYTLCGVDGNDPSLHQQIIDLPEDMLVDCIECISIWRLCSEFDIDDFDPVSIDDTREAANE